MALNSGTPKTDWTSSEVVITTDLNRIEGNIQDLDTSKINKSGPLDFRNRPTYPDEDVTIKFASDATLTWDESEDSFVLSKPIKAAGLAVRTSGELVQLTVPASSNLVIPAGIYAMAGASSSGAEFLYSVYNGSNWTTYDDVWLYPGEVIVSDGANIRLKNTYGSSRICYLRRI